MGTYTIFSKVICPHCGRGPSVIGIPNEYIDVDGGGHWECLACETPMTLYPDGEVYEGHHVNITITSIDFDFQEGEGE